MKSKRRPAAVLTTQVIKNRGIISLHGSVEFARPFRMGEKVARGTQGRGKTGVPVLTGLQGPFHITGNGGGLGSEEGVRHTAPPPSEAARHSSPVIVRKPFRSEPLARG